MKITLVAPPMPFSGRVPMAPPVLEYMGALTMREMPGAELELVDAGAVPFDPDAADADLVGISAMTATATWAYATADRLRGRGVQVVLGGIHPTALPDEAATHADSVVVGEAESVWGEVLADAAEGALRTRYDGERLPLDAMPLPLTGALSGPYRFRAVFTMRGCPYRCTFCSVRRFFGDTIRYRPIEDVAREVRGLPERVWFNGDDNIWGGDADRSVRLFDVLADGPGKRWYGFGDLRAVQGSDGDRLLAAARRSGLFSVWAGWESDSTGTLDAYHATGKQGRDREDAVKRMQAHGIEVVLFMVLGGRTDGLADYERALELADRLNVGVHPVLLTPLPGTELYEEYEPHLLPGLGWDSFTGSRAVFAHPDPAMSPAVRERAYYELALSLLSLPRILRRAFSVPMSEFPEAHMLSVMKALPVRRAMRKAYSEWTADVGKRVEA